MGAVERVGLGDQALLQQPSGHASGGVRENAIANGAIVHWAKDAEEHNEIVLRILRQHDARNLIKSKSMLTEECHMNEFLMSKGIDVVESDLGERILQLMHLARAIS